MRSFRLLKVDYSLEEAVAIEGFTGYVRHKNGENILSRYPVEADTKGRPMPIIGVCFMQPQDL